MSMSFIQRIVTIVIVIIGTIITRFLPFLIFPESTTPPRYIQYLGKVLPFAVIGMLVIYSLKNVSFHSGGHGLPEIIVNLCHELANRPPYTTVHPSPAAANS